MLTINWVGLGGTGARLRRGQAGRYNAAPVDPDDGEKPGDEQAGTRKNGEEPR